MANLSETSVFTSGIYQLERSDPIDAGTNGDGVSNLQAKQLANRTAYLKDHVDAIETEITNARGGEENLDARLDGIQTGLDGLTTGNIFNLEALAAGNRQRIPSSFKYDAISVQISAEANDETTSNASRVVGSWNLACQLLANASSGMANKLAFRGTPAPIYVDGYPVYIEQRPSKYFSTLVNFSAAPSTGTRLDFAFLEVWKEKVSFNASDDVLFPYGCVMFEDSGTFDSCTLYNTDASGGNNPAYLASAANHGYYVKANDANIKAFMANPKNNVVVDQDGNYYQIRWRIRTVAGVASANVAMPHDDTTNILAQGKLAAPSAYSFASVEDDIGLSKASNTSLALDGIVRAIPIALVHRRNTTAWALTNPNGAGAIGGTSGRPDGLFYNHIDLRDILDLRQHGMFDNNFNYEAIYKNTLDKVFSCSLATSFENLMSDTDGNGTYKDLGIYGTKLLRADGIAGTLSFDASWEVIWRKTAENGITCKFDGIRNYFSDVGGDQAILGYIPNVSADGVSPTSCFTYVSSSKTFAFDATNLDSGNDLNSGASARTKVSVRKPRLVWASKRSGAGSTEGAPMVDGTWTGLGGDSASFVISGVTRGYIGASSTTAYSGLLTGAVYQAPNGAQVTIDEVFLDAPSDYANFTLSGNTFPNSGTWSRISGTGPATIPANPLSCGNILDPLSPTSVKVVQVGEGSNLHSGHGIHVQAYATFQPGSGVLTRLPYQSADSIKATHFNLNVGGTPTQMLPNNGVGFIPFGTSVNPVNDGNGPGTDSHTRQTGMVGFLYKNLLLTKGASGSFTSNGLGYPSVIKDGSTYKMWFTGFSTEGYYRIGYSTSSDGLTWAAPQMVMDVGTGGVPNSSHSAFCSVIKDGSTYRMWFSGYSGSSWAIMYSTSTNGTTWQPPSVVITNGSEPNGYNTYSYYPCVIKDGSTFKMWFAGYSSDTYIRMLHSTSPDGSTWSTPVLAMNVGIDPMGFANKQILPVSVIKDGSLYKAFFSGYSTNPNVSTNLFSVSTDGVNWSAPTIMNSITSEFPVVLGYIGSVIKDGPTYKAWYTSQDSSVKTAISHAVLSMTDSANTGSSLTGVYATEGTKNFAPPSDSQVVMFYEAMADQMNRTLLGTTYTSKMLYWEPTFFPIAASPRYYVNDVNYYPWSDFSATLFPSHYHVLTKPYLNVYSELPSFNSHYTDAYSNNNSVINYNKWIAKIPVQQLISYIGYEGSYSPSAYTSNSGVPVLPNMALYGFTPIFLNGADEEVPKYMFTLATAKNLIHLGANTAFANNSTGYWKPMVALGRPVLK